MPRVGLEPPEDDETLFFRSTMKTMRDVYDMAMRSALAKAAAEGTAVMDTINIEFPDA
jgi:hypothetical protein